MLVRHSAPGPEWRDRPRVPARAGLPSVGASARPPRRRRCRRRRARLRRLRPPVPSGPPGRGGGGGSPEPRARRRRGVARRAAGRGGPRVREDARRPHRPQPPQRVQRPRARRGTGLALVEVPMVAWKVDDAALLAALRCIPRPGPAAGPRALPTRAGPHGPRRRRGPPRGVGMVGGGRRRRAPRHRRRPVLVAAPPRAPRPRPGRDPRAPHAPFDSPSTDAVSTAASAATGPSRGTSRAPRQDDRPRRQPAVLVDELDERAAVQLLPRRHRGQHGHAGVGLEHRLHEVHRAHLIHRGGTSPSPRTSSRNRR